MTDTDDDVLELPLTLRVPRRTLVVVAAPPATITQKTAMTHFGIPESAFKTMVKEGLFPAKRIGRLLFAAYDDVRKAVTEGADQRARFTRAATAPLRHVAQRTPEGADDGRDPRLPRAGTVLHREHNGKDHAVTVHEKDFEYRGKRYTSLSKIAKEITGTHWNGWLFFNLATRKRGAAA